MELEFSQQIFEKYSYIKFHENLSSVSQVVHADKWADMTKLTVTLHNFTNSPENYIVI